MKKHIKKTDFKEKVQLSVILPCRNEEEALEESILSIKKVLAKNKINGEIIVSDSSTDNSPIIAKKHRVKLIKHDREGYGQAYLEGFRVVKGKYIFCADPDGTYDFSEIVQFLKYLESGYDLVIGNRFAGNIAPGAMSVIRRYIGNPLISSSLRLLFKVPLYDSLCGMRAFNKDILKKLDLQTIGMEFASEMVIKATKHNLKIKEAPIDYFKRKGNSKLKPIPDGFRHLKFILRSL